MGLCMRVEWSWILSYASKCKSEWKVGPPKTNMTSTLTKPLLWHARQHQSKLLTEHVSEEGWSGAGRQVDANVVDRCARQRHSNSHQRVDGVAVEGNHDQENAAQAVDDWEEQRQLQGVDRGKAEEEEDMGKVRKKGKARRRRRSGR